MNDMSPKRSKPKNDNRIMEQLKIKDSSSNSTKNKKVVSRRWLKITILILLAGVLLVVSLTVYSSSRKLSNQEVINKVDILIDDLPKSKPTIATIEDAQAIAEQDGFYEGAKKGDKVLIYTKEKRAIIYSPKGNKIVKDGKVSVDGSD